MLRKRINSFRTLLDLQIPKLPTERSRVDAAQDLHDLRRLAQRRTPKFVFDYVAGAAGSEQSARANRTAFTEMAFVPNTLRGVGNATATTELLGVAHRLPVGIAPTGLTALMRAEGELAGVRAAANRTVPFALSTMGTKSIEDVTHAAPDARRWFQLYLRRNIDESLSLIRRAAACGYDTLVLTVDTPVPGRRLRDNRNGLSMPPKLTFRTAAQSAVHPTWTWQLLAQDAPSMANFSDQDGTVSQVVGRMFDPELTVTHLDQLREVWTGKLVVKGVLSPDDASLVLAHGADAVWLSNHGGRQLDHAVAPVRMLPAVREAVGPDATLILDSGIRNGTDVVAALALGANFTFIGRPYLYALMAGGQHGVERALDILHDEIVNALQLLGCRRIDELRPEMIFAADRKANHDRNNAQ